jgi:hypothetical protein
MMPYVDTTNGRTGSGTATYKAEGLVGADQPPPKSNALPRRTQERRRTRGRRSKRRRRGRRKRRRR